MAQAARRRWPDSTTARRTRPHSKSGYHRADRAAQLRRSICPAIQRRTERRNNVRAGHALRVGRERCRRSGLRGHGAPSSVARRLDRDCRILCAGILGVVDGSVISAIAQNDIALLLRTSSSRLWTCLSWLGSVLRVEHATLSVALDGEQARAVDVGINMHFFGGRSSCSLFINAACNAPHSPGPGPSPDLRPPPRALAEDGFLDEWRALCADDAVASACVVDERLEVTFHGLQMDERRLKHVVELTVELSRAVEGGSAVPAEVAGTKARYARDFSKASTEGLGYWGFRRRMRAWLDEAATGSTSQSAREDRSP